MVYIRYKVRLTIIFNGIAVWNDFMACYWMCGGKPGRHIQIRESAGNVARLLREHLPLAYLLIRRLDGTHQSLETIAIGQAEGVPPPAMGKTMLQARGCGESWPGDAKEVCCMD